MVGLYWIKTNHPVLIERDDAYNCYRAAYLVSRYGDLDSLRYKTYINVYPHNLTLVSYFMIFTKIFGDAAPTYIRLANLVYVLFGYIGLYGSVDYLYKNEKINSIMICLMFMSMQCVFYSFFVYGNALSYSTGILSIYFFIKYYDNNKLFNLIIAMLFIVISSAIKNNSLIILVGEMIFIFVKNVNRFDYKSVIVVVLSFFLLNVLTSGIVNYWSNKADTNYDNRLPRICWIAYDLNYEEYHQGRFYDGLELYHSANDFSVEYTP